MSDSTIQPAYMKSWDFLQRFHPGRLIVVTGICLFAGPGAGKSTSVRHDDYEAIWRALTQ